MNDHHLDPPDDGPEPPQCPKEGCDGFGEIIASSQTGLAPHLIAFTCEECGHLWTVEMPQEPDPAWEVNDKLEESDDMTFSQPYPPKCPHGNEWGECGACDHAGDLAFDAERERRFSR